MIPFVLVKLGVVGILWSFTLLFCCENEQCWGWSNQNFGLNRHWRSQVDAHVTTSILAPAPIVFCDGTSVWKKCAHHPELQPQPAVGNNYTSCTGCILTAIASSLHWCFNLTYHAFGSCDITSNVSQRSSRSHCNAIGHMLACLMRWTVSTTCRITSVSARN